MLKIYLSLILLSVVYYHECLLDYRNFRWLNQVGLCKFSECCHPNDGTGYIKYNKGVENLRREIISKVHGQPLILDPIYKSLLSHVTIEEPSRPLVMYFSGWTGTGKTYVAHMIARNLYKMGMQSRFVKYISSSFHFPVHIEGEREIQVQRARLLDMIRDTIKNCERSLIILDELDKLPAGVVDVLQPMFDYVESVDGIRYNKAIFIFLSNTGATELNKLVYKMYQEGYERKDLRIKDIEEILINESLGEPGGLHNSAIIKRHSIGVFVPFLPLERDHVQLCVKDRIKDLYSNRLPDLDGTVREIADEMTYFPGEIQKYSKSGCKRVQEKVINNLGPPEKIHTEL